MRTVWPLWLLSFKAKLISGGWLVPTRRIDHPKGGRMVWGLRARQAWVQILTLRNLLWGLGVSSLWTSASSSVVLWWQFLPPKALGIIKALAHSKHYYEFSSMWCKGKGGKAYTLRARSEEVMHRAAWASQWSLKQKGLGMRTFLRTEYVRTKRTMRSKERRVGKECRSRWSPYH